MMNNVFLVKSPLQFINALEAKYHFNLNDDNCLLVIMGDRKSYPQMLNLAKESRQWHYIVLLNNINILFGNPLENEPNGLSNAIVNRKALLRGSLLTIPRLKRISKYITDIDHIFIGDYNYVHMRHFVNTVPHNKTVLLDDGVGAINTASIRRNNHGITSNLKFRKRIKVVAKRLFQGLNDRQVEKLCFFSAYDLDLNEKDEFIRNEYKFLKKRCQLLGKENSVYFIGSPLSEAGIMNELDYLNQLKMIRGRFSDMEFKYIAHRREHTDKLDTIHSDLNIEIYHFDYPIEYQLAMIGPIPKILISFVTSALENLRIIMGNELKIISYRLIDGTYSNKEHVDSIYRYYEKNISDQFVLENLVKLSD